MAAKCSDTTWRGRQGVPEPEQLSFAQKVAERVVAEENCGEGEQLRQVDKTDPLRWALHGGPGIGKSHTLRVVREELFDQVLGWQQGVQNQVVAFQAVMADQLAGETIHHAVGLNKHGEETGVSLQLLARLELRCRELVRDACKEKYGPNSNAARPFGGLNVILVGDMWQLEPPRGTFLGAIPAEMLRRRGQKTKLPHAAYGQRLVWGGPTEGVQGVTELVRCERTQDAWLKEVQDQFRHGRLTAVTHAFLHGKATAVPGSWHNGHASCGSRTCEALATDQVAPERILEEECKVCKSERRSKALVAATPQDPRLQNELKDATCIFCDERCQVSC